MRPAVGRMFAVLTLTACITLFGAPCPQALGQASQAGVGHGTVEADAQASPPRLTVTWAATAIDDAIAIFPHPVLSRRAVLSTERGLLLTDDAGGNWTILEQAVAAGIGRIAAVAFSPTDGESFYAAGDKGIWLTSDRGKTFQQVGSKASGLADEAVRGMTIYADDRAYGTLLAWHGEKAAGISVSYDGGKAWQAMMPGHYVRQVVSGEAMGGRLIAIAAKTAEPDIYSVYSCERLGEAWQEMLRDVVPTEAVAAVRYLKDMIRKPQAVLATADAGLYALAHNAAIALRIGPADTYRWCSIGTTFGPAADSQLIYAYEPQELGLVTSIDGMQTFTSHAEGLAVGPFIKEGSHVRANAGGTSYYGVINNVLYVGAAFGEGLTVSDVTVQPGIYNLAREEYERAREDQRQEVSMLAESRSAAASARRLLNMIDQGKAGFGDFRFHVTAQVRLHGAANVSSVFADLSTLGGSDRETMFDDGQHGDGQPGDGVYGTTFRFNINVRKDKAPRMRWPGELVVVVTAVAADGKRTAAAGVAAIRERTEDLIIFDEPRQDGRHPAKGSARAAVFSYGDQAYSGQRALRIDVQPGDWQTEIKLGDRGQNIAGFDAVSFWLAAETKSEDDLCVHLRDNPVFAMPSMTGGVGICQEGLIAGGKFSTAYRRVVVPIRRLLKDSGGFQPALCSHLVLTGSCLEPQTFWIDNVRLVKTLPAGGTGNKP